MSTLDEQDHLGRCLDAVAAQDYPADRFRLLVVDGGSRDATPALLERWAQDHPGTMVWAGLGYLSLPAALNIAVEASTADLVAKVDAHGWPEPDFLRRAAEALAAAGPRAACAGGRPEQHGTTPFGEARGGRARQPGRGGGQRLRGH